MSVDVALPLPTPAACSYCDRPGDLIDDGDGGWMHADPADCRLEAPLRIAGEPVTAEALAAPPSKRDRHWSALADAELLAAGEAHVTPADVPLSHRRAVCRALREIVSRRLRVAAFTVEHSRRPAEIEGAAVHAGLAASALARWMREATAVRETSAEVLND